jgi:Mg2+ and Co2+ transporter CorA
MPATVLTHGSVTWMNIVPPTQQDIDHLASLHPELHPLNLKDCLTLLEIPKLDHFDEYLFLVIHLPYWDKPYWGDISDHLTQLCAVLDEYAEVISGLSETADTLASHRIDEVIRLLTIVTVVTLPTSILATLFGMNIVMPFAQHPLLFYGILISGLIFALVILWFLTKRRWL